MNPQAADLLAQLSIRGIAVVPDGSHLRLSPRSALTPELLDKVRILKGDLHSLLTRHNPHRLAAAGACPTPEEWSLLNALSLQPALTRSALLQALAIPSPSLDMTLISLLRRHEITRSSRGAYSLLSH